MINFVQIFHRFRNGNGAFASKENTQSENIRYPLRNAFKKLNQPKKSSTQYSPLNLLNFEDSSPEQNERVKSSVSPDSTRRRGLTKYDQDLIEKCTFTESRCRPLAGKRKINLESVYTSVKRPRKSVHIIRGKPNTIAKRLKANAVKKLTILGADEDDLSKNVKSEKAIENGMDDGRAMNLHRNGPMNIKLKRRKKKTQPHVADLHDINDNNKNCEGILKLKFDYRYEDFLNNFKMQNLPEECIQVINEQCKTEQRNCICEQRQVDEKDVYEFNEDEDNNEIEPLSRKSNGLKNESRTEELETADVKRDYVGKIKLTLKMKKSSMLDNMLEVVNSMPVMEPQYEVLRVEAD